MRKILNFFSSKKSTDKKKELQRIQQEEKQQEVLNRSADRINKVVHTESIKPKFFQEFEEATEDRSSSSSSSSTTKTSQHSVRNLYSYVASIKKSHDTSLRQINKQNLKQQSISSNNIRGNSNLYLNEIRIQNQQQQYHPNLLGSSSLASYINNSLQFAEQNSNSSSTCSSSQSKEQFQQPSKNKVKRNVLLDGLDEAINLAFSTDSSDVAASTATTTDKTERFVNLKTLNGQEDSGGSSSNSNNIIKEAKFVFDPKDHHQRLSVSKNRKNSQRRQQDEEEEEELDHRRKMLSMKTSVNDTPPVVGIIGGTGIDRNADFLEKKCIIRVKDTIYGAPSENEVVQAQVGDIKIFLISRHGAGHSINPSNVNYRANIRLLQKLGCNIVLATTACGSLKMNLKPGNFIVLDSYIDR